MTYATCTITGLLSLISCANAYSRGWLIPLFLAALELVVYYLHRKQYLPSKALLGSTFIVFVISGLFWAGGLLVGRWVMVFLAVFILSFINDMFD